MFWLTTVAGFYALLFITIEPLFIWTEPFQIGIVVIVWLYAILTVVIVLMFWTRGKVTIGVAAGFILVILPFVLYGRMVDVHGEVVLEQLTGLLFFGSHGAGLGGGIDAIIRQHTAAGWTAFILTSVSIFVVLAM